MSQQLAAWIWGFGLIAWFVIRYPFIRRARKAAIAGHRRSLRETLLLWLAGIGLAVVPGVWLASGFPAAADYEFSPVAGWIGALLLIASLVMFRLVHSALGRNWSVTLEIREGHRLVDTGPFRLVRHPMYSSFFLWALAQALLLPNWVAGLAGLAGIALLYALRVNEEEAMLIEAFGDDYRAYMERTWRLVPWLH